MWILIANVAFLPVLVWQLVGLALWAHRLVTKRRAFPTVRRRGGWVTPTVPPLMVAGFFAGWLDHLPSVGDRAWDILLFAWTLYGSWAWIRPEYTHDGPRRWWDTATGRVRSIGHRLIVTNT